MHRIEAFHKQTGQWMIIADTVDDPDEAQAQIEYVAAGCNDRILIWGCPVVVADFSAFRVTR